MSTGGDNVVCSSETTYDSEVTLSDYEDTTSDNTGTDVVGIESDVLLAVASSDSFTV